MTWAELRNLRKSHGGAFAWYLQCNHHGIMGAAVWCPSCDFVRQHNLEIREELRREFGEWAAALGWDHDEPPEPAGDVPMERAA
jgi:hypothetical protein